MHNETDHGLGLTAEEIAQYVAAVNVSGLEPDDPDFLTSEQYHKLVVECGGIAISDSSFRHWLVAAVRAGRVEKRVVLRDGQKRPVYRPKNL